MPCLPRTPRRSAHAVPRTRLHCAACLRRMPAPHVACVSCPDHACASRRAHDPTRAARLLFPKEIAYAFRRGGAVNDGAEAREALRAACAHASSDVAVLCIVRFRGATFGSLGKDVADVVGDMLFAGEGAPADAGDRPDPPGLTLAAFRSDGAPLGRISVHPAAADLEAFVTTLALDAAARIGCGVEVRADDVVLERFGHESIRPRPALGYRDAPPDLAAPFAGLPAQVTREGERVRVLHETAVHTHAIWLPILIVLSLIFWWALLPALLFRGGRDWVFGLFRRTLRKAPFRWQAELGPHELVITDDDAAPFALPLAQVRLVSLAPPAWTKKETTYPPVLRLLLEGRFVQPVVPTELRTPLAIALRSALGHG